MLLEAKISTGSAITIHPSINFLPPLLLHSWLLVCPRPIPAVFSGRQGCQFVAGHSLFFRVFNSPHVHVSGVSWGGGGSAERTHAGTPRTLKIHTERPRGLGIEPTIILLRGNSANHSPTQNKEL